MAIQEHLAAGRSVICCLTAAIVWAGCAGSRSAPIGTAPEPSQTPALSIGAALGTDAPVPLGLYDVRATLDPPAFEILPSRSLGALGDGKNYAVDTTAFFRGDCADCFRIEGLSVQGETLTATVRLRHPFPLPASAGSFGPGERLDLHVFDAMLLVHNRTDAGYTTLFPQSGERLEPGFLTWGSGQFPPDGYTDLLEPWFEAVDLTNAATLDPYIIFSRSPQTDPTGNFDPEAVNGFPNLTTAQGFNSLRQGEERILQVQLHLKDRTSVNLQVALLASYMNKAGADPAEGELLRTAVRQRPVYQLPAGNLLAPWRVQASATPLLLTPVDRKTDLTLDIWDWQQAAIIHPTWTPDATPRDMVPFNSQVQRAYVEVPGMLNSEVVFTGFEGTGRGTTPLRRTIALTPEIIPPAGLLHALVTVVDQRDPYSTLMLDRSSIVQERRVRTWQVATIEVQRPLLVLDPGVLVLEAVTGVPIAHQFEAFGGVKPYTYTLTGPAPSWLQLHPSTGTLSGIPAPPLGSVALGVRVRDSGNPPAEVNAGWTLRVRTNSGDLCDEPDPLITTPSPLPSATRGVVYIQTLAAEGGRLPLTWQLSPGSTLPAGLVLSPAGVISGTPADSASGQSYTFAVTVRDACPSQQSSQKTFDLDIPCTPLEILTSTIPPIAVGQHPAPLQAVGEAPLSWSVISGAPALAAAGLTLQSNGSFSGAALLSAEGSIITFTVRVADQCATGTPVTAQLYLPIQCAPPPVIVPTPLPPISWNQQYSSKINATGGQGTLTWSLLTPQTVPRNFSLAPDGTISFFPDPLDGGGTWYFQVEVRDTCYLEQRDVWETVIQFPCPATPRISEGTPPLPEVGLPFSYEFKTSTGTGSITWVSNGILPPGLQFNPQTAILSGTVTTSARGNTYQFTISVSDDCGLPYPPDDMAAVTMSFPDM